MNGVAHTTEEIVRTAVDLLREDDESVLSELDGVAAALFATDRDGMVSYFNRACIPLSGRTPIVGSDRWCVTWRLYTHDGKHLPHDECPMAIAVTQRRPVRGVAVIAERPDGTRVCLLTHPTPVLGERGEFLGAVNVLIDVDELAARVSALRMEVRRCRRLAVLVNDDPAARALFSLADDYEERASLLQQSMQYG